jgi:hypothetical protein
VASIYVGNDDFAQLIARRDEAKRRERLARCAAERAERQKADEEDREIAAWFARVEAVASAAMIAAGFRKHHRSTWRRQRMSREVESIPSRREPAPLDAAAIEALLKRAQAGDASCKPDLRALFEQPGARPILDACGSPPSWLEGDLIAATAGEDLAIREASLVKLAELRRELEGPDPSPTERLLAERAALCWWIVHRYESSYATSQEPSIRVSDFHQRRIDRAHYRFLSALKALATVRKLALPALQVNIGMNQVNQVETRKGRPIEG